MKFKGQLEPRKIKRKENWVRYCKRCEKVFSAENRKSKYCIGCNKKSK